MHGQKPRCDAAGGGGGSQTYLYLYVWCAKFSQNFTAGLCSALACYIYQVCMARNFACTFGLVRLALCLLIFSPLLSVRHDAAFKCTSSCSTNHYSALQGLDCKHVLIKRFIRSNTKHVKMI